MSEITGGPLTEADYTAIGDVLRSLPDGLGQRAISGLVCAAALGNRLVSYREGDTSVLDGYYSVDSGETKERFKREVFKSVAESLGIDEPESKTAVNEVISRLAWTDMLATGLERSPATQKQH